MDIKSTARQMHAKGTTNKDIGLALNFSDVTIGRWLNPELAEKHKERRRHYNSLHLKNNTCPCGQKAVVKYCSNKCQSTFSWERRKKNFEQSGKWAGVRSNELAQTTIDRLFKRYLLELKGNRCEICLLETWLNKPMPLILDHIDGDSNNSTVENLRLVCGNCDMMLPTYKGRNIGKGRAARRNRYKNGLSY